MAWSSVTFNSYLWKKCARSLKIAKRAAESTAIGNPEDEGFHIGPLFDKIQFDRVQAMIQVGIEEGATLLAGGLEKPEGHSVGWYAKPTVFLM